MPTVTLGPICRSARRTPVIYGATPIRPTSVYKLRDVAKGLDVSVRTLERVVAAGKLTAVRAGRHTFVTGRSLLAWLEGGTDGKGQGKRQPDATHP
jgi:excisionase family DNA binding protein